MSSEYPKEEPLHDNGTVIPPSSSRTENGRLGVRAYKNEGYRSLIRKPLDTLTDTSTNRERKLDAKQMPPGHSIDITPEEILFDHDTVQYPAIHPSTYGSDVTLPLPSIRNGHGQEPEGFAYSPGDHDHLPDHTFSESLNIPATIFTGPTLRLFNGYKSEPKAIDLEALQNKSPEASLALLDTISMVAVQPREELSQQQDIFINNHIEDIARRETLMLPAINVGAGLAASQLAQAEKQQIVAKTAGGAAIAGAADLISSLLRYVITVVMTHMVSPAVYGIFVESNTVVTILGYAAKLGLDSVQLRFLATYRAKGERAKAAGLILFASSFALIFGLICAVLFFAGSSFLARSVYHREVYELPFRESALLVPLTGMQLVLASGLQALKFIKWKVYVDRLIQPCLTLVLLIIFYLLGLRLEALIYSTICGYLASICLGHFLLQKAKHKLVQGVKPLYVPKVWLRFALPMFFNSMIRNVLNSTDILFLGVFATTTQLGFYGTADRMSYFVVAPLIALNSIFSPIIAELHAKEQHKQLESMFKIVTKWSFSLSWPIFLACLVFHDAILDVFGEKYMGAGLPLVILAFGNLVDAGVGSVNYLLVMTGRPRVILANTVSTVVINIALAFLLVPRYSIIGAAVAAALTLILLNIVGLIEVYWIMHIHPYRLDIFKPLAAGVCASIVGWLLTQVVHTDYGHLAIFGVLELVIPFVLVYVLILALLRFSEEDKMVFNTVGAKFAKKKAA